MVDAWCVILRDANFHNNGRLRAVAAFIATNGFSNVVQMRHAAHPKHWDDAGGLSEDELRFANALKSLRTGTEHGKARSR